MPAPTIQQTSGDGVVAPTLAELVALSQRVVAWPNARRASGGQSALAHSPLRGRGMEYAESRPYLAGDDARHIDWRLSARTGKAHSKLFHPERERTTLLVCDASPALRFGTRIRYKSVQAARAAALAAWAASRAGERVGAVVSGEVVKPGNGQRGVLRVLRAVADAYAEPGREAAADLGQLLVRAMRLAHTGSRLIVVADPSSVDALPDGVLAGLARHNDVLMVMLADAFELDPPYRSMPLRWAGRRELVDLSDGVVREAWHVQFSQRIERITANLQRLGIGSLMLTTHEDGGAVLQAMHSGRPGAP